jgi:hypothetical protein
MKFSSVVSAAIASCCLLGAGSASSFERHAVSGPAQCAIEFNGDSILHGYANAPGGVLGVTPAQWLRNYGYTVNENNAVNGQSTFQLARNSSFYGVSHSLIVVIQTGINDYRREYEAGPFGTPTVQGVKQDYRNMVDYVRGIGKIPVISGITDIQYPQILQHWTQAQYNTVVAIQQAVRDVATEKNVHYASFDINPLAWTDTVHLDQASSNGIAENLRYVAAHICMLPF